MPPEQELGKEKEIIEFADKKETDFSSLIVWLAFVVALLFAGFIWFSNSSLKKEITDKQNAKTEADSTLALSENKQVVSDVLGLKQVISILTDEATNQKSKKLVLDDLYKYFTKDVHISTIALSDDGTVGIDGVTASYRTAADFMLGLKSYSKVSALELKTISMSTDPNAAPNAKVSFSVSFKLDMTKDPVVTPSETTTGTDPNAPITTPPSDSSTSSTGTDATGGTVNGVQPVVPPPVTP